MMKNFAYVKAGSLAEAIQALGTPGAWLHAGGTDLLGCARNEILPVEKVVSISNLNQLKGIAAQPDGGLRIGALTPLAVIAADPEVAAKYAALAQAAAAVGTPQIREQGTLGGNLCQRPRCWYFRGDFRCLKKGGGSCYAATGENQYHAIFGGGPCFFVHPSDLAVALTALRARVSIAGPAGKRIVPIDNFFVGPKQAVTRETVLTRGEIVTEVTVPASGGATRSLFKKAAARGSWDFALVSAALALEAGDEGIRAARLVLGGVGPYPWRAGAAEKLLLGGRLDGAAAASAAEAAVAGATALRGNAYKPALVRGIVAEALEALI